MTGKGKGYGDARDDVGHPVRCILGLGAGPANVDRRIIAMKVASYKGIKRGRVGSRAVLGQGIWQLLYDCFHIEFHIRLWSYMHRVCRRASHLDRGICGRAVWNQNIECEWRNSKIDGKFIRDRDRGVNDGPALSVGRPLFMKVQAREVVIRNTGEVVA